jgi:hypothetical protein
VHATSTAVETPIKVPIQTTPHAGWTQPARTVLLRRGTLAAVCEGAGGETKAPLHQPRMGVTFYQGRQYQRRAKVRGRVTRG